MIAPYWSDVDTRCDGEIYYRQEEHSSGLFKKIQHDVALVGTSFKPKSAVVVTWKGVASRCGDKRVSSGDKSFIINDLNLILTLY